MKNLFFISALLSQLLFFSVLSIFGAEYQGINESSSYLIFCISSAALSLIFFLIDYYVLRYFSLNLNAILILSVPVIITLFFYTEHTSSDLARRYYTQYLLFSLTSSIIGIYIARRYWIASIAKWFEVVMIIFSISVIFSLILPFAKNEAFVSFAGSSHQTASYTAAFAYSLNLFFILFDNYYELFNFHYLKAYKILMYVLLPLQILGVIASTGRGGFVVVIVATIFLLWYKNKEQKINLGKTLMIILFFVFCGVLLLPKLLHNDLFIASSARVFSYVSDRGIDMSQTSGREIVFNDAIKLISDKPLTGYGLFGYLDYMYYYPHNIFLEILLNGGILYLLIAIFVGLSFLWKLRLIIFQEPQNLLMLAIFIYPIIELQFTGTYMTSPLFWFAISYVFCYRFQNDNISNGVIME